MIKKRLFPPFVSAIFNLELERVVFPSGGLVGVLERGGVGLDNCGILPQSLLLHYKIVLLELLQLREDNVLLNPTIHIIIISKRTK